MPLALLIIGALFITAAVRGDKCGGKQCADVLFETMKSDFTGPNNFIYWGLALFLIGAAGYYKPFKPFSNAFLGLIILVLFISNRGFFAKFMEQIGSTQSVSNSDSGLGSIVNIIGGGGSNSSGSKVFDAYTKAAPQSGISVLAKAIGL